VGNVFRVRKYLDEALQTSFYVGSDYSKVLDSLIRNAILKYMGFFNDFLFLVKVISFLVLFF
jgi:hypothetical protein